MSEQQMLLQAVAELATECGKIALSHYGGNIEIESKSDGSPVTVADRDTERFAREWIAQRFPTDGIIGEEFGAVHPDAARQWVIDPIDGTATFVRGVPLWGTLVAVMDRDKPIAGAVNCPVLGELLVAAIGEGSWWNSHRAYVSSVDDIRRATVVTTDECFRVAPHRREVWERLQDAALLSRSWGDCYGYLLVGTGRAEVMVDGALSLWDAAAVMPVIQEAGGVFTDWSGQPTPNGKSAIATNAALADTVRAYLVEAR